MGSIISGATTTMGSLLGMAAGTGQTGLASALPTQNFTPLINQANENIQNNIGNQNAFAQALQTQMNGGGPNLAGSLLSNATGQNVANQAALMASQRGTGSNAGLIARQAAQQGAQIQQKSAGQMAAERQQQQLGAQGQLGNVYGQIGNEAGQNLATNQQALANQNQNILGINQTNANIGMQNTQNKMNQLAGIAGAANSSQGGGGGGSSGGKGGGGGYAGSDTSSSAMEGAETMYGAEGGEVNQPVKENKLVKPLDYPVKEDSRTTSIDVPQSSTLPDHLQSISDIYHTKDFGYARGGNVKKVNAMVSPGERELKPDKVKKVAEGKADPIESGKKIPGKPKVPGAIDSYSNDTVPKKLAVGSIIIPRSVTQGPDPKKAAFAFVVKELSKKKKGDK